MNTAKNPMEKMQNCIAYETTLLDLFSIDRAELPSKERERESQRDSISSMVSKIIK